MDAVSNEEYELLNELSQVVRDELFKVVWPTAMSIAAVNGGSAKLNLYWSKMDNLISQLDSLGFEEE